jgi:hypothetical protein
MEANLTKPDNGESNSSSVSSPSVSLREKKSIKNDTTSIKSSSGGCSSNNNTANNNDDASAGQRDSSLNYAGDDSNSIKKSNSISAKSIKSLNASFSQNINLNNSFNNQNLNNSKNFNINGNNNGVVQKKKNKKVKLDEKILDLGASYYENNRVRFFDFLVQNR